MVCSECQRQTAPKVRLPMSLLYLRPVGSRFRRRQGTEMKTGDSLAAASCRSVFFSFFFFLGIFLPISKWQVPGPFEM